MANLSKKCVQICTAAIDGFKAGYGGSRIVGRKHTNEYPLENLKLKKKKKLLMSIETTISASYVG